MGRTLAQLLPARWEKYWWEEHWCEKHWWGEHWWKILQWENEKKGCATAPSFILNPSLSIINPKRSKFGATHALKHGMWKGTALALALK